MATPSEPRRSRHWVYLDEPRTHEVHAQIDARGPGYVFSTTEFPAFSRDPAEAIVDERALTSTEQLALAMRQLEERLALSGTYFRADVADMRFAPLPAASGARKLDLRAHEIAIPGGAPGAKMGVHHFHAAEGGRDRLLVTLPRLDQGGARSVLAQLDFDFPNVDAGDLAVLHPRLAAPTLRSALAKAHVELPTQGFAKLIEPTDYQRAFGSKWIERTRETFRLAASRVLGARRLEPPAPLAKEEYPAVEARSLAEALRDERVRALRSRYLGPGDADSLLSVGELAIRRYIQQKRRRADHHAQFDLSVVESSLLVEYGLRREMRALLDEEGAKLLRMMRGARA